VNADEVRDAARLLAFALQPRAYAAQQGPYAELLSRYRTDAGFRAVLAAMAEGLGLVVLEDTPRALLVGSRPESVFAFRLGEYRKSATLEQRVVRGLIMLGIAAYCYPTRRHLEGTGMPLFSARQVDDFLRAACERLRSQAGEDAPLPEATDLATAWQLYLNQPAVKSGERRSRTATIHLIEQTLEDMEGWGLVKEEPTVDRVRYFRALPRFRAQVREMGSQYGFAELARIRAEQAGAPA
jgi:hypothetical protein